MKNGEDDPFPAPETSYDNVTDEHLAALEAQAEQEDRAAGKGALYDDPPPLPEVSDDDKARSLHHGPFGEAFGNPRIEILLCCRTCGNTTTYEMWDWAARLCPEYGSNKGADRA